MTNFNTMLKKIIIKTFFLLIAMFTIATESAQNLANLDSKYGINKFKLESELNLYEEELEYLGAHNGITLYNVKYLKSLNILNKEVTEVLLTFYKDKLHSISVVLKTSNKNEEFEVLRKLENLFGSAIEGEAEVNSPFSYEWAYLWETEKVYLGYNKMSYESEFKPGICTIYMISLKLQQQRENDFF